MLALIKLSDSYSGGTNLCQIVLNHPHSHSFDSTNPNKIPNFWSRSTQS